MNEACGGELSRARVLVDAALGQCVVVRRRVFSPRALWRSSSFARASRGVALSTQSPLLGDLALDIPVSRAQYAWRVRQKWRFFTYPLAHGSLGHVAWDLATLRSALALGDRRGHKRVLPLAPSNSECF